MPQRSKKIIVIVFLCFVAYSAYTTFYYNVKIEKKGHYTIGYIKDITAVSGGYRINYLFVYRNDTINSVGKYSEYNPPFDFKRYYVRFLIDNPQRNRIMISKPVPDNIQSVPSKGWENIPDKQPHDMR